MIGMNYMEAKVLNQGINFLGFCLGERGCGNGEWLLGKSLVGVH